ncbi:MAG: hypothetical protein Kow0088_07100 [Anaerolineales bacterium]
MMIDYSEFRDWIDTLYHHPEWREELRRLVLTEDILELPRAIQRIVEIQERTDRLMAKTYEELFESLRQLSEAQRQTEQSVKELLEMHRQTEQSLKELAEAQKRTDQRFEELAQGQKELAEAQRRTEQRVEELAEAQRRTEQRVEELAEAQRRTEQRVGELAQGQKELAEAQRGLGVSVGALQRVVGATVEEAAAGVAEVVLSRKGYRILQPAFSLALDGEIDVVLSLEDPTGRRLWAVVEAKARLSQRDIYAWSQRMHSRVWHQRLAEKGCSGPYLVYAYGIRTDLSAQQAAQKEGIGLLKSDREVLEPAALVESLATSGEG